MGVAGEVEGLGAGVQPVVGVVFHVGHFLFEEIHFAAEGRPLAGKLLVREEIVA